jgi:acetyl esterase/lipase
MDSVSALLRHAALDLARDPLETRPVYHATDDALTAYRALLEAGGEPTRIVVAGESAGAGLAMATLLGARRAALPQPAAGLLFVTMGGSDQSGQPHEPS